MADLSDIISRAAAANGVPPQLLGRVMAAESSGNPYAVSSAGAAGPMGLMPGTAADLGVENRADPSQAIPGAARYLRQQYDRFGSWPLALAAYNAGPTRVARSGGVPDIPETRSYVAKTMGKADDDIFAPPQAAQRRGRTDDDIFAAPSGAAPPAPGSDRGVFNPTTGIPYNDAQATTLRAMQSAGTLKAQQDGSFTYAGAPVFAQTDPKVTPAPGSYWVNLQGQFIDPSGQEVKQPTVLQDMAGGGWTGLKEGATALLGLPGSVARLGASGIGKSVDLFKPGVGSAMIPQLDTSMRRDLAAELGNLAFPGLGNVVALSGAKLPDAAELNQARQQAFGRDYQPVTTAGQFARAIGQNAPAVALPAEGLLARGAAAVVPALTSETAGQFADRYAPQYATAARIGGGLFGGGLAARIGAALPAGQAATLARGQASAAAALDRMGVTGTAPDVMAAAAPQIARGAVPEAAAAQAASATLPVPVQLMRGQATLNPRLQMQESMLLKGGGGDVASRVMQNVRDVQQRALFANLDAVKGQIAGAALQPGQGGAMASDALNAMRAAAKAGVNQAYQAARSASPTILPAYDAQALAGQLRGAVTDYDPLRIPAVGRELDRLEGLSANDVDLKALFDARSRLSNLRMSNDSIEAGAARTAVRAFDSHIADAMTADLFHGDPASVQAWRDAIAQRRDFGNLFESGDLIEKLTTPEMRNGVRTLAVDPHDAANYIFGRSALGFVGRQNLYRDLGRMRDVLGAISDAWSALRAEAFQRFADQAQGAMNGGVQDFSGVKFAKAWNGAKRSDPQLINTLFAPQERDLIDQLSAVAARATNPVKGGENFSNTAVAAAQRLASRVMGVPWLAARATPILSHVVRTLEDAGGTAAARNAISGQLPRVANPRVPLQVIAGATLPILNQQQR
jgi:hypothetical protein